MSSSPRLELRQGQGQSLVMTQALQQSIKLLQCNALELREFVDQELEKNPFLAEEEGEGDDAAPADESAPAEEEKPRAVDEEGGDWGDDSGAIESDYLRSEQHFSTGAADWDGEEGVSAEERTPQEKTLREHLLEQLHCQERDAVTRMIAAYLIDLVDETGYIKDDMRAAADTLGASLREVEAALAVVQSFDPPGVGARTLQECLSLQLRDKNRLDPAMQALLDHLHLLADSRFDELQKRCGVDRDDLKDMIGEIRALNPKPGAGFQSELVQAVEPDMFVRRTPDGNWHVELNMANFPRVMVNKRYYQKITAETRNKKDKDYLSEHFGAAGWLVRALEQRAQTMLKVGGELVKQQDAFFRLGVRYLKPMTLKTIAAETGYHESTISRVTNGKFLVCPRGTFELKYFFTSALARAEGGGDDVSSNSVKDYIREMIAGEKPDAVLSDDDIVDKLKDRNIDIARRTVAKYREALGIPASPKRRRVKAGAL